MKLQKDSYEFIYELLCDYAIANVGCMTAFELNWLENIRQQFTMLHKLISERCD